tara:strand:- start:247 stop:2430 length:2184 start_codon:yes stop_codon:yes gene_type:complete
LAGSVQAKIDVIIGGLREVAALEGRLEAIQSTITAINKAPVDLNVGGRGRSRDLSGKLSKNVNDLVRNFDNFGKSFSSVNKQAVLFGDLLSQTALKSTGEFKKQDVAVKNLATAYTTATSEAARFERQQVNLIRTSRGLQTSTQREIDLIKKRTRVSRLRERKRRGQNLQQDILLGAGFPLLFGGGVGAVAGGLGGALAGGGRGGFGAQVFGSAIGQQFDALVDKAVTLGKALNPLTFDLEAVAGAAGIAGTETVQFLENIERYAGATEAARLATQLLETRIGKEGRQALQDFGEAAQDLGNALSTIFTQVLANIVKVAGPILESLAKFAGRVADVGAFKARTDLEGTDKLAQDILNANLGKTGTGGLGVSGIGASGIKERARKLLGPDADLSDKALREFAVQTAQSSQRKFELPVLEEIKRLSGQVTPPSAEDKTAERLAERTKEQSQAAADRLAISKAELAIAEESSELSKIDLEFDLRRTKVQQQYAKLFSRALSDQEKSRLEQAQKLDLETLSAERNEKISNHMRDQFDALSKVTTEMQEMAPFTKELSDEFKSLANTINNEIISGIEGMIDGTKTLGQVASSMLKKIASQMLQTAIMGPSGSDGIAGTIFKALGFGLNPLQGFAPDIKTSGIKFFASGGRPPVGRPSVVGERGPELFVPRTSGTIVPNEALGSGANVTVNVDASGSSVQGDGPSANQLGKAIGAAVQAELIKQKRPGGLLTR